MSPVSFRTPLFALLFSLALIASVSAQGSRADTAARTSSGFAISQAASSTREAQEEDTSFLDLDLGEQIPVETDAGGLGLYAIANTSLSYTSNATLSNGGRQGDMVFVASGGAGLRPHIAGGLYLNAYVNQDVFQYARFSSLNFSRFNAGGGLDYVFENLGNLIAYVRYDYERFLDGDTLNEFYVNNALSTGLAKEFSISDNMAIQTGGQAVISLAAEPIEVRRNSYDIWLGWRWRLADPLELQTYYVVSLFHYTSSDRVDLTQNVGASLNYTPVSWLTLSASAGFAANNSTDSFFNYTVVNLGGSLGLDIRF